MLHKWEAMMGLSEDSLAYQMEEYYHPEETENDQDESSNQLHS